MFSGVVTKVWEWIHITGNILVELKENSAVYQRLSQF